ncbi:TolC family protein [Halosquirtibacter xylanolyticus]|uniref:TolC family protein n=1 Tax=Halosquirtibacter xylanolyticus TaxID=3374599 RepID=UPI0037489AD0|nr:TolC family protein [Prolixibacteraceae bacterium]
MKILFRCLCLFLLPLGAWAQQPLSLEEAIQRGLENNYDIRIQDKEVAKATTLNSWGQAGRYPSITFVGKGTNQDNYSPTLSHQYSVTGGVTLNWVLFDGFRINITKAKLADLQKFSEGNAMVIIENTVQSIILGYYQLLQNQSEKEVLARVKQLSYDRLKYVEEQRKVGTSVKFDYLQAKNNYLADKAKLLSLSVTTQNLERNLAYLMGDDSSVSYKLTTPLEVPKADYVMIDLEQKMRSSNRNLINQYLSLAVITDDYRLSKSGDYPSVNVTGSYNYGHGWSDASGSMGNAPVSNLFIEMGVRYNLFNGGIQKRAKKVAKYNVEVQELRTESLWLGLKNQLINQFNKYMLERELFEVANEAEKSSLLNLEIAQERYNVGAINSFNYRDIQIAYQNAALGMVRSKYRLIETNVGLVKLTGGILNDYTEIKN